MNITEYSHCLLHCAHGGNVHCSPVIGTAKRHSCYRAAEVRDHGGGVWYGNKKRGVAQEPAVADGTRLDGFFYPQSRKQAKRQLNAKKNESRKVVSGNAPSQRVLQGYMYDEDIYNSTAWHRLQGSTTFNLTVGGTFPSTYVTLAKSDL